MAGQESSVFRSIYRPVAVCCRPAGEVRREPGPRASTHVLLWAAGVLPVTDGLFLQEPRHLQLLADLEDCSVFSLLSGKKQYSAPTDFGLCLKVRSPPQPPVHPASERSHPAGAFGIQTVHPSLGCCFFFKQKHSFTLDVFIHVKILPVSLRCLSPRVTQTPRGKWDGNSCPGPRWPRLRLWPLELGCSLSLGGGEPPPACRVASRVRVS